VPKLPTIQESAATLQKVEKPKKEKKHRDKPKLETEGQPPHDIY
jgi:hypothetical protein